MSEEQKEALDVVENINEKLFIKYDKDNNLDYLPVFSIIISDYCFSVSLSIPDDYESQEIKIFNSENNDRIYYEKTDTNETFENLFQRKFSEIKKEIFDIKW